MAGQVKRMLDHIIKVRSNGSETIAMATKTKLILKGLNPDKFGPVTHDDPATIAKVTAIGREIGIEF